MAEEPEFDPSSWTGAIAEQEWRESSSATDLIHHLVATKILRTVEGNTTAERKLRLFGVAACRQAQIRNQMPDVVAAITGAELFADGQLLHDELVALQETVERLGYPENVANGANPAFNTPAVRLARAVSFLPRFDDGWVYYTHVREMIYELEQLIPSKDDLANLIRDIFGNPFHPVTVDPAWRTSTVLALAQGIYDERAFDRMPILADALQDAGCDNADILAHCRDPQQVHVRGCWVVDLVLGKE